MKMEGSTQVTRDVRELLEFLSEDLKCSLCLEFFVDPRSLTCLHVFCKACLDPLIKTKVEPPSLAQQYFLECPLCRFIQALENADGVDNLPKNYLFASLIEKFQKGMYSRNASFSISTLQMLSTPTVVGDLPVVNFFNFKIEERNVHTCFVNWIKSLTWTPANLHELLVFEFEKVQPLYIPFWIFDVKTQTDCSFFLSLSAFDQSEGRREQKKYEGQHSLTRCASKNDKYLKWCLPPKDWSWQEVESAQQSTEPYTDWNEIWKHSGSDKAVNDLEKQKILDDIDQLYPTENVTQLQINTNQSTTPRLVYFPFYLCSYSYRGKTYQLIMNGFSGEVNGGERPIGLAPIFKFFFPWSGSRKDKEEEHQTRGET